MIPKGHENQLKAFSNNIEVLQEFYDLTITKGSQQEASTNKSILISDWYDKYLGFRVIKGSRDQTFFPLLQVANPVKSILRGISEYENKLEAMSIIELPHKIQLNSFSQDYLMRYPQIGNEVSIGFAGLAYSVSHQLNPPTIDSPNGKKITTKGSSIFYHAPERVLFDYTYQFFIESITEFLWNDFLVVYKIKTTLFRLPNLKVSINLFATERVLQDNYIPNVGDDIIGVLCLVSQIM